MSKSRNTEHLLQTKADLPNAIAHVRGYFRYFENRKRLGYQTEYKNNGNVFQTFVFGYIIGGEQQNEQQSRYLTPQLITYNCFLHMRKRLTT